jgi:mRNA interferase RelE/StbE
MVNSSFVILYHSDVKTIDLQRLDSKTKERIKKAIETRLISAPQQYGEPLRKTLKGYWKLRVGDYRVVFKIVENKIWILGIIHRKEVYEKIERRTA